eukprot:NODE_781_length_4285_cov_0.344959.p1 type:complete len:813 gc:universal NODE_781_length_4285_cov_0.344959:3158-720(-)
MFVSKRNGRKEKVYFDKITSRLNKLCYGLSDLCDPILITQKVIQGIYNGITTVELDNLAAETSAYLTTRHPDYAILAARIAISNLHKETDKQFSSTMTLLYNYHHPKTNQHLPKIDLECYNIMMKNKDVLDAAIIHEKDYHFNYFGFKTLQRSYLLKINNKTIERPQHLLMRVAVGIHKNDIPAILETYQLLSSKYFTHASPTLFNAGCPKPQLSSCFLVDMKSDSIEGIYDTLKTCALISKTAGGIGLNIHCIRASGSYIAGTNGHSNGLIPMLRVFNNTARYVDQGGNKRPGAFAIYIEPWHADIFAFLDLRKNHGKDEDRARDLFYALWICDLFMKRVENDEEWSLFCPNEAPGLADCHGEEFNALYRQYEQEGRARQTIKAQKLWFSILDSQIETGTPYMLYKDACNSKSNHSHLGTIRSSNLCTEILEYTAPDEVAVCNLASVSLPAFVVTEKDGDKNVFRYDFKKLHSVTQVVVRNLNKIIDVNYYPVVEASYSNKRHRPVGVGVQGLADVFMKMRMPFDSLQAKELNKLIFETIYHASLTASIEIAKVEGTYSSYEGSPISKGILQCDMWGVVPSDLWDWDTLRSNLKQYGCRNSLLVAPMPTASTSQILGNNECFEPYTSNIYLRRVLSGEFTILNPWMLKDLTSLGLWNDQLKQMIISDNGSIQNIECIPKELKKLYKTVWEISQKTLLDMAADRGAFIDQSQSLNIFLESVDYKKLTSMHFYGWKLGLKTGMYYLRTKSAVDAIKFTIDKDVVGRGKMGIAEVVGKADDLDSANGKEIESSYEEELAACRIDNGDGCMMCSG